MGCILPGSPASVIIATPSKRRMERMLQTTYWPLIEGCLSAGCLRGPHRAWSRLETHVERLTPVSDRESNTKSSRVHTDHKQNCQFTVPQIILDPITSAEIRWKIGRSGLQARFDSRKSPPSHRHVFRPAPLKGFQKFCATG